MGHVYLVRHGQARFGTQDYDRLSELGVEQSRMLGDWLAKRSWRVDHAVTGSLLRHRQTAEACMALLPDALRPRGAWTTDAGFDEFDADEVMIRFRPEFALPDVLKQELARSDRPRRAFHALFTSAMGRWMGGRNDHEYRESWRGFQARCVAGLERVVGAAGASKNVIVFTSGGPITAICQHLLELPNHRAFDVNANLVNSAVTGLLYQPGLVSLSFLNNFAHLEQTGKADLITYG